MTERRKAQLEKKIDQFKTALRKEKAMFGGYDDGRGYRYEIACLYFELGDHKKTNRYLNWFDKNFPDDVKFPYFNLGASVSKFGRKKFKEAKIAVININDHNTYLIDLLLGNTVEDQHKYEWIESEGLEWATKHLRKHLNLTTPNYIEWLKDYTNDKSYQSWYRKLISIKKLLKGLEIGKERSELLDASRDCIKNWKSSL